MNARLSKEGRDGEGEAPPLCAKQPFVLLPARPPQVQADIMACGPGSGYTAKDFKAQCSEMPGAQSHTWNILKPRAVTGFHAWTPEGTLEAVADPQVPREETAH